MSDIFSKVTGNQDKGRPVCRVAYTLNDAQPVMSTIIGDQPLFYMDYEDGFDDEDEGFFDIGEIGLLDHEISSLKESINAYKRFSAEALDSTDKKCEAFALNAETFSAQDFPAEETPGVEKLTEILKQSRTADAYLAEAQKHNVKIHLSAQVENAAYDKEASLILINAALEPADRILLCARELRRHWQHRQGVLINPLLFHPDNAVLINRLQNADLTIHMVRIAWELQLAGHKEPWNRLESSSLEDISRAFAKEAFLDFRTINNGEAMAAALESWFLSERCQHEDKSLIHQMLADYRGYVFDAEQAGKTVTPDIIRALGSSPFGKNYLAGHAGVIMNDPIFTDVRDRSNANFLWFIKFERSYRETEQGLQPDHLSIQNHGARRGEINEQRNRGPGYEHTPSEVVTLYTKEDIARNRESAGGMESGSKSADIVYLNRWPSDG